MKLLLSTCIIGFFLMNCAWAADNFANVGGWQGCTKTVEKGPYKFSCLPPARPSSCSESSWDTLTKGQLLPWCPLCPLK